MADAQKLIAEALGRATGDGPEYWYAEAVGLVTVLRDAGLLVEPGGETRTEWGIGWTAPAEALSPGLRVNEADDEAHAREVVAGQPAHINAHVVSRTVYTGPWKEQP